jgi:NTE family protein
VLGLTACAPRYNLERLTPSEESSVQRNEKIQQDEDTLVFVAFSGGGTRAAAMSWKTLETLKQIPYPYTDRDGNRVVSTLADEIDYISGISGGSFAASAWCLYREDMDYFRENFLERNIQGELVKRLFLPPWNALRLFSRRYNRIHLAAELYHNEVFEQKTFGDVPPHPVLWIHATNLPLGNRFSFTPEYFEYLNSDLPNYPIGYACAASSAFPILLSPLTLLNYGEPVDLEQDLTYSIAKLDARLNVEQDYYRKMREFYNNKRNRYIHLADGGLVDNQGLQTIIDQFATNGIINKKLNERDHPLKRLIIINVNAGIEEDDKSSRSANPPRVPSVVKYTMTASMNILSAKRWMSIKALCRDVNQARIDLEETTASLSQLEKPYTIEISFRNIQDADLQKQCLELPTSFYLTPEQLRVLDEAVPALVREDPDIIRLKEALGL